MRNLAWVLAFAAGCGKAETPKLAPLSETVDGTEYYPLAVGATWTYDAVQVLGSNEPETLTRQYVAADLEEAPDQERGFLLDESGRGLLNSITMVYGVREQGVVTWSGISGITRTQFDPPFVELPASIGPGAVWTWNGTSKGASLSIESRLEGVESVAVPAGIWDCLRITRSLANGGRVTHWYAKGVGLVKMDIRRPAIAGLAPASSETWALRSR